MAPKKNATKRITKKVTKRRCNEVTNNGGIFYRCVRKPGHKDDCQFDWRMPTPRGQPSPGVCKNVQRIKGRTARGCIYAAGHTGRCSFIRELTEHRKSTAKLTSFELFLQAVQEFYTDDRLAAGINVAWLPDKQTWYASVSRYEGAAGLQAPHRLIVCSTTASQSAATVIAQLAYTWRQTVTKPAKPAFAKFVKIVHDDEDSFRIQF